jgi:hypothetical protein
MSYVLFSIVLAFVIVVFDKQEKLKKRVDALEQQLASQKETP